MLTSEPFDPAHMAEFEPGAVEAEYWHAPDFNLVDIIGDHPAITVRRDGRIQCFAGSVKGQLWSEWSAEARARPLPLCRFLKRHLEQLLDQYGVQNPQAKCPSVNEAEIAAFLGLDAVESTGLFWRFTRCHKQ